MEFISSFLATASLPMMLIPVLVLLVVVLVIFNIPRKVEAVEQVPIPPVTTTPAPAQPTEVVAQAIAPIASQVVAQVVEVPHVEPVAIVPNPVVVPEVIQQEVVVAEVVAPTPIMEAPAPAPAHIAPVENHIEQPIAVATELMPSWRPTAPAPIGEEEIPFESVGKTESISDTLLDQSVTEEVSPIPTEEPSIPVQAIETELIDGVPTIPEQAHTQVHDEVAIAHEAPHVDDTTKPHLLRPTI